MGTAFLKDLPFAAITTNRIVSISAIISKNRVATIAPATVIPTLPNVVFIINSIRSEIKRYRGIAYRYFDTLFFFLSKTETSEITLTISIADAKNIFKRHNTPAMIILLYIEPPFISSLANAYFK